MSGIAIRVDRLSKQYTIGVAKNQHDTLRDQITGGIRSLFRHNGQPRSSDETIWALKDVSFEVNHGEILGIIGRNGAGKSTLLKILSRITEPTEGRAEIYGRVGALLEVGTGFHQELTGRENIYLYGSILGMNKHEIERKFDQIVAFSEVDKFIDTPVKHYSSGMYVRLAFSVAAHLDPDILLIDEVLSVGDLSFQRKCMAHAKRLQERNTTVILVSHNMFAVTAMCNRAICISGGQVRFDGSPEDAISFYEQENRLTALPGAQARLEADPSEYPICITGIGIFDEAGQPSRVFNYGDRMRVRLTFEARQKIINPNFVVAIIRSDNVPCCNYNTAMDGITMPSLSGQGSIEVLTPPLKLISELYTIHVLVWDTAFQRRYFTQQTGVTFHVRHELLSTHFGVFHESAEWFWPIDESEVCQPSLGQMATSDRQG
jgi:lipopolysaccharide transport system ATP-binding protein